MRDPATNKTTAISPKLIAPCGMNCHLCLAFTRERKQCPGCRSDDSIKSKSKSCIECKIKNCKEMAKSKSKYCFACDSFPCEQLTHLDKRYKTKYGMSMIANLEHIRNYGIRHFIRAEKERWACPKCGEMLCVHKPQCLYCQHSWR